MTNLKFDPKGRPSSRFMATRQENLNPVEIKPTHLEMRSFTPENKICWNNPKQSKQHQHFHNQNKANSSPLKTRLIVFFVFFYTLSGWEGFKANWSWRGENIQTNQRTKNAVDLERICKCKVIAKMQGKKIIIKTNRKKGYWKITESTWTSGIGWSF